MRFPSSTSYCKWNDFFTSPFNSRSVNIWLDRNLGTPTSVVRHCLICSNDTVSFPSLNALFKHSKKPWDFRQNMTYDRILTKHCKFVLVVADVSALMLAIRPMYLFVWKHYERWFRRISDQELTASACHLIQNMRPMYEWSRFLQRLQIKHHPDFWRMCVLLSGRSGAIALI